MRAISISLGSKNGDFSAVLPINGKTVWLRRIGCDGNLEQMQLQIRSLDGLVEAFGLGGTDLYLYAGRNRYCFRDIRLIAESAQCTPVVDGSTLKNTLEIQIIDELDKLLDLSGKKVLMVSSVDRPGMASALQKYAGEIVFGDIAYGLGLPIPIKNLRIMSAIANCLLPVVTRLPFKWFYPTGASQDEIPTTECRFAKWADVIAGDFHYIKKNLPLDLGGKVIITNTVRSYHVEELKRRGLQTLVTTTPDFNGQSFGTNAIEAAIVAAYGKVFTIEEMREILPELNLKPNIIHLNPR